MGRLEHRPSKPFIYGWAHTVYSPCRWHVLQVATASIAALDRPYGTAYPMQLPSEAKSAFLLLCFPAWLGQRTIRSGYLACGFSLGVSKLKNGRLCMLGACQGPDFRLRTFSVQSAKRGRKLQVAKKLLNICTITGLNC
jgi:hypothetical protein